MGRLGAARAGMGAWRSLPREVYVLGLVAFCVAVGFGVLVPVLPVFARSFGVGNAEVGAVISAFALMRLISSPFCGWLIKILSERIIMATGIFIVAISSGLAGLSRSYVQLLVLRGVGGIGSAMFTVSAFTLLLTSVEAGVRGRAAGFFQAGFLIGGITGPALGGVLSADLAHSSLLLLRRDTCRRWNGGTGAAPPTEYEARRAGRRGSCRFAPWYATPVIRRHASATSLRAGPRSESGRH